MTQDLFLPDWPPALGTLSWFALLLIAAVVSGELAARSLRLPRIVGYVLAGMALGPHGADLLNADTLAQLRGAVLIALGLLLFELGHRLAFGWLRANPWLLASSVLEAGLSFALVFAALYALGIDSAVASAAAAIGMSSSPATAVRLTAELRSQGQVSERLLMLAALNSVYAVLAMTLWLAWQQAAVSSGAPAQLLQPIYVVCGSFLLAMLGAVLLAGLHDAFGRNEETAFLILAGVILLVIALAQVAQLSVLLALLALGALAKHRSRRLRVIPKHFSIASALFIVMLFALTGARLDPGMITGGPLAAFVFIVARQLGKLGGVALTGAASGLTARKALMLGLALAPMSGLAVALVQDSAAVPEIAASALQIVLAAVVAMEIVGPVIAAAALAASGESKSA